MPLEQLAKSNSQNGDEIRFLKDDFFHLPVPHGFTFPAVLAALVIPHHRPHSSRHQAVRRGAARGQRFVAAQQP
jgi:hypothetical protein